MPQEKLSGLVIVSIEKEMLVELEYKNLISNLHLKKKLNAKYNIKKINNII